MRQLLVLLISLSSLALIHCDSASDTIKPTEVQYLNYLEKGDSISFDQLSESPVVSLNFMGDTLLVMTLDSNNQSELIFWSLTTSSQIKTLTTYHEDESFVGGTYIDVSDSLIYVGSKESRVIVLKRHNQEYLTTLGVGTWWGPDSLLMVHSFGATHNDSLFYVRDKGRIRTYAINQFDTANAGKIPFHSITTDQGNNSQPHALVLHESLLYSTDYGKRMISIFNETDFNNTQDSIAPVDSIELSYRPIDIDYIDDALWVTELNGVIHKYDLNTYEETGELSQVNDLDISGLSSLKYYQSLDDELDVVGLIQPTTSMVYLLNHQSKKVNIYE